MQVLPPTWLRRACCARIGGRQWPCLMAAGTVTILAIVVRFFCTRKTFIQGIAPTGAKD